MEIDLKLIIAAQSKKFVREFNKVVMFLENALIPDDRIENTPSVMDGLSADCENDLRILGCEMIQTAGILLNLPQVSMATGQVLFQRFFYSKSFVKHNYEIVAMACINLASKIEEAPRRVRDVANVFHHIKQIKNKKSISPMILDANYVELKNQVIKSERRILKELGFAVHVKHPHKIIVMFLQVLECEKNQHLIQCAWNYMNDSFRTNVFVRFTPESISAACIYLAARQLKICLPNRPHWFLLFGITEEDIQIICRQILQLYSRIKPNVDELDARINELRSRLVEQKCKEKQERVDAREAAINESNTANNSPELKKLAETNGKPRHKKSRSRSRTPTAYKKSKQENSKHNSRNRSRHKRSKSKSRSPIVNKKSKRENIKDNSRNRDRRSSSNSNRSSSNHHRSKIHSPSSVARLVHQKYLKSSHHVHSITSQKSLRHNI